MDDKNTQTVKDKLVLLSVDKILSRIQENYEQTFDKPIHREYALEHFESLSEKFKISVNDDEKKRLSIMKMKMYDDAAKKVYSKASNSPQEKPFNNVYDIKTKVKKFKP